MVEHPNLDPEVLVNGQILITSYFDINGKLKYAVHTDGDMNLAQALGLLRLADKAIFEMYEESNRHDHHSEEFEEDDDDDVDDDEEELDEE